jgi:hypothetical protein
MSSNCEQGRARPNRRIVSPFEIYGYGGTYTGTQVDSSDEDVSSSDGRRKRQKTGSRKSENTAPADRPPLLTISSSSVASAIPSSTITSYRRFRLR